MGTDYILKSRSSNLYFHSLYLVYVCSNSSRCNICLSSRAWPCLWPHCPWASPLPHCPLSPPALACFPSRPSWPTTPTARPRQWRRTRAERQRRELPGQRTGTSQISAGATRRFGGGEGGYEAWGNKVKSVTVECNSVCLSAECWCREVPAGMMTSREGWVESCGCSENDTAEWLRVRVNVLII